MRTLHCTAECIDCGRHPHDSFAINVLPAIHQMHNTGGLFSGKRLALIRLIRDSNPQLRIDCFACGQNIIFLSLIENCGPRNLARFIGPTGMSCVSDLAQYIEYKQRQE